jgi:hypothetical protein
MKIIASFVTLTGLALMSWSVSATTISGSALSGLTYHSSPDAQYVAGSPDVAQLYTPDAGVNGDAPAVYVRAANLGLSSMGALNGLSASYDLYSSSGGSGNQPYWLTYLYDPFTSGLIGVVSFGGPTLNGSTQIHVFYDFDPGALTGNNYWGDTLSQLDSTAYGTTTFGQMEVYETGVEIGDWAIDDSISASASIDSITVNVPDVAYTAGLLGLGLFTLIVFRFKKVHLQMAK